MEFHGLFWSPNNHTLFCVYVVLSFEFGLHNSLLNFYHHMKNNIAQYIRKSNISWRVHWHENKIHKMALLFSMIFIPGIFYLQDRNDGNALLENRWRCQVKPCMFLPAMLIACIKRKSSKMLITDNINENNKKNSMMAHFGFFSTNVCFCAVDNVLSLAYHITYDVLDLKYYRIAVNCVKMWSYDVLD